MLLKCSLFCLGAAAFWVSSPVLAPHLFHSLSLPGPVATCGFSHFFCARDSANYSFNPELFGLKFAIWLKCATTPGSQQAPNRIQSFLSKLTPRSLFCRFTTGFQVTIACFFFHTLHSIISLCTLPPKCFSAFLPSNILAPRAWLYPVLPALMQYIPLLVIALPNLLLLTQAYLCSSPTLGAPSHQGIWHQPIILALKRRDHLYLTCSRSLYWHSSPH